MVAEWMLRMGGSIVLEGQRKPITDLADLPAADFRIHALNFTGITMYAASLQDELRRLPALPHLKELYINGRLWYDQPAPRVQATISLFNEATALEKFVMSKPVQTYIPFNDPALKGLTSLKNLKEVRIHQTRSSGMSLAAVSADAPRSELRGDVQRHRHGEPEGKDDAAARCICAARRSPTRAFRICPDLTNLVELDLSDVKMTDVGLSYLSGLTKLRRLNLQSANVTDAGIDVLKNMPELEELSLYRTKVSNAGLAKLSGLKNLRSRRPALQPRDELRRARADVEAAESRVPDPRVVQSRAEAGDGGLGGCDERRRGHRRMAARHRRQSADGGRKDHRRLAERHVHNRQRVRRPDAGCRS